MRMTTPWVEATIRIYPSCIMWRGPRITFGNTSGVAAMSEPVCRNLASFLKDNFGNGREAELAINAGLRHVVVRVDGELVLTCGFDDLVGGAGGSTN
jgi:hypothetical protein